MSVTIFHNPACSTSRKVLEVLRETGVEPKIVLYLNDPPSKKELATLLGQMKMTPRELLRKRGTPYEELGLGDMSLSDAALIDAMVTHPILIERPIVITAKGAVLCRPAERVYEVLPDKAAPAGQ